MEQMIYIRRDRALCFRNIVEMFPTIYDRAVIEIKKNTCKGDVNYQLFRLEFKGENYSTDGCNVDVGIIIEEQDESKPGLIKHKKKSCINVIVITAPDKERLSELERKIGLDGTLVP